MPEGPYVNSPPQQLDPIKAHAALCAATALSGRPGSIGTYAFNQMAQAVESYLRGKS
jgi:hypothetical protein